MKHQRDCAKRQREGRAEQHSFNGYPNRYTVPAGDFVPFIIDGPPVEVDYLVERVAAKCRESL